jgi:aspartate kinase
LDADKVTIWKDVPGILSADPKLIDNAKQIMHLPYTEASEMTYYGASVIHPKTIKPLANKNIPLYVRSFDDPSLAPTEILGAEQGDIEPTIIFKKEQCLITFRVRDYTFVDEKSLAMIFNTMHDLDISLNILQSSAITISVCFDYKKENIEALFDKLKDHFSLHYMTDLELITLKNYDEAYIKKFRPQSEIILEQRSRRNCRFLIRMANN